MAARPDDPVDLQQRRQELDRPGSEKIAGAADRTQRRGKVYGNRWHGLVPVSRILTTRSLTTKESLLNAGLHLQADPRPKNPEGLQQ